MWPIWIPFNLKLLILQLLCCTVVLLESFLDGGKGWRNCKGRLDHLL